METKVETSKRTPQSVSNETQALTSNAVQIDWRTPSEFPSCPKAVSDTPLEDYKEKLTVGECFCKNGIYSSLVLNSVITDNGKALWIMCKSANQSIKPWSLAKIVVQDDTFVHENKGTFFSEEGAQKDFTIAQGLEWTGGEVFDDFC